MLGMVKIKYNQNNILTEIYAVLYGIFFYGSSTDSRVYIKVLATNIKMCNCLIYDCQNKKF